MMKVLFVTTIAVILLGASLDLVAQAKEQLPAPNHLGSDYHPGTFRNYGSLPLSFEANQGQTDPSVRFLSRGDGYALFLTDDGAVLSLGGAKACPKQADGEPPFPAHADACASLETRQPEVVRMTLGGRPATRNRATAMINAEEQLPGKVNYFIGKNPAKWRADLPTFAKIRYTGVYPGIDLVYYGNQRQLEYDFAVAPGADPAAIRLDFAGQSHLRIAANGDLEFGASKRLAAFHKPVVYQEIHGERVSITAKFQRIGSEKIGFALGQYDHTRPLVIDPVLIYSTYLGGSGNEYYGDTVNGLVLDSSGNAYVVGTTSSFDFPVTKGSYQTRNNAAYAGNINTSFVSKLNAGGTAFLYSTFLGGTGINVSGLPFVLAGDFGNAIAIDASQNVYLTGSTFSSDFPVTSGAFQTVNDAASLRSATAFVAKLNAQGNALVFATYLGQGHASNLYYVQEDIGFAIAIDQENNVYVAGTTTSNHFPTTPGSLQENRTSLSYGRPTGFVTKFNPNGTGLLYSTYLGGSGCKGSCYQVWGDSIHALAVDSTGNAYLAGSAYSGDFPTTPGAFQTVNHASAGSGQNAFLSKLDPSGSSLVYSTFLGGTGQYDRSYGLNHPTDSANAISVDADGNVYAVGPTNSTDFPFTSGVVGPAGDANGTGFLAKLNPSGSALVYATALGGSQASANAVAVDGNGVTYVAGAALPGNLALSQNFVNQTGHLFVAKLNTTATRFDYVTLLGGSSQDQPTSLALDASGRVVVAGWTYSQNFTVSAHPIQPSNGTRGSGYIATNGFVSALDLSAETTEHSPSSTGIGVSDKTTNSGQMVTIKATVTGTGTNTPTGHITFSGQYCSTYVGGFQGSPWTNCGAIPSVAANLDGSGVASIKTPALGVGFYTYKASYSGDINYLRSDTTNSPADGQIISEGPLQSIASDGGFGFSYNYGAPFGVQVLLRDAAGYPLMGRTVNFSGAGLKFDQGSVLSDYVGRANNGAVSLQIGHLPTLVTVDGSSLKFDSSVTIVPVPLQVVLRSETRDYGSANPVPTALFVGLANADVLTLTSQTVATPASPVGTYPLTATVSGANAVNYSPITVSTTTLRVKQARLNIVAGSERVTYGQTPLQPTSFSFVGFVNGDTASVVHGSPTATTSVTSSTPVGYYPYQVGVGTLTADNYYFAPFPHPGVVQVGKAPLTVKANNQTMPVGGPIPPLTYSFNGFVNSDNAANSVTGAPVLRTSATTYSKPGIYPIYISNGTLASHNYHITSVVGTLTITP